MHLRAMVTAALTIVLLLMSSGAAAANEELRSLQDQLALINQQQQALYQQFQMIQQLRRSNVEPGLPQVGGGPPGNYDEMIATKRAQAERDEAYARELRDLYQRHRDLEREKQPIIESMRQLRESAPSPAGKPPGG